MNKRCYRMIKLGWLATLLPGVSLAASLVTLDEAVKHALQHNAELHASEQQVQVARQQLASVEAAAMPVVSLSHSARVSDNPLDAFADKLFTRQVTAADFDPASLNRPGSSELYLTSLSLKWPVYTGGELDARQRQSGMALQQSRLLYQHARQVTAWQSAQAYLYAVAAQRALGIAEQAVVAAQHHADTTARLAAEGRIVESDKLAAEVNLAAVKAQQVQAVTRHQHALTRLRQLMGLPPEAGLAVGARWPPTPFWSQQEDSDVGQHIEHALQNRHDLLAAQKAIAAAGAGVDVASADKKPSVALVASSNWYDDAPGFDNQSSSLMAVASIKLYDGASEGKLGMARARQKEQQWREQALQQQVRSQVKQAFDDVQEATTRLALASDNVSRARQAVQLVQKRYGQGRTILLDLLQSERAYTEARIEKLTAELNLRTSRLTLAFASGKLALPEEGGQ